MRRPAYMLTLLLLVGMVACAHAARTVVYWNSNSAQGWSSTCSRQLQDFPAGLATHLNLAFATLSPELVPVLANEGDNSLAGQLQLLKQRNPELKTLLSIGGWSTDPTDDPQGSASLGQQFSQVVGSQANRTQFVTASMELARQLGFDGVEIAWQAPEEPSVGGRVEDAAGVTALFRQFRGAIAASGTPFLLTLAAGPSPGGYPGLDIASIHPLVDFINLWTFDYHGPWEGVVNYHAPWFAVPPGKAGIQDTLDHYMSQGGVPAEKLSLGLVPYGRTWTLSANRSMEAGAKGLGAAASGPGIPSTCPGEPGILGRSEMEQLLQAGLPARTSTEAMGAYLVLEDQWVSFESNQTLALKLDAAAQLGLGGVMVWQADLDDEQYSFLQLIKRMLPPEVAPSPPTLSPPPPKRTDRFCGGGRVGNGQCRNSELCCSPSGHCGTGLQYCRPRADAPRRRAAGEGSERPFGFAPANACPLAVLDRHNYYRAQFGAPPLQWSDRLAASSRDWCSRCVFEHSDYDAGPVVYGENLALNVPNCQAAVDLFMSEELVPEVLNHETQVLWKTTTHVGCAYSPSCALLTCRYLPAGNVIGQWSIGIGAVPGSAPQQNATQAAAGAGSGEASGSAGGGRGRGQGQGRQRQRQRQGLGSGRNQRRGQPTSRGNMQQQQQV